ncbi:CbiX/SirB N-terminal domain-containing protein [Thermodesulfovibrio sp. 3907-1M]|uniref:CbiX/SirB N-terminal domain-containing protein n=1 Tax=Thermodesulfovibrio autotrophicus TaxID=3118333 RepID=A0AAU8GX63_9BACT
MEKIIIVAHGSYKKDADNLEEFTKALAVNLKMNPEDVKYAYLQYGNPSIEEILSECIKEKTKKIIIHPLFLFSGFHVNSSIPEIIEKFRKNYPNIEIQYTKPLSLHEKLIDIVKERIEEIKASK